MQFDPSVLSWKDWVIVGWVLATLWHSRSRTAQGKRLGTVERAIIAIAAKAGIELDEDSNPGVPAPRKRKAE